MGIFTFVRHLRTLAEVSDTFIIYVETCYIYLEATYRLAWRIVKFVEHIHGEVLNLRGEWF